VDDVPSPKLQEYVKLPLVTVDVLVNVKLFPFTHWVVSLIVKFGVITKGDLITRSSRALNFNFLYDDFRSEVEIKSFANNEL